MRYAVDPRQKALFDPAESMFSPPRNAMLLRASSFMVFCVSVYLSQYVIELRVEEAKHLLADPANSKANIALALGFCDQSHFSATFKKETGLTPGQYQTELNRQKETGP
jgi:AraC-like DNA-binding protein